MRVLLTGGSGDLGFCLVPRLLARGDTPVILDIRPPRDPAQQAISLSGSILDRPRLKDAIRGCDAVVHIAAWHGIHEERGKGAYDFFDLNVRGTFEVFEATASLGVDRMVYISTTSVRRPDTLYGRSKRLAEQIAEDYATHNAMHVVTLRPRGFIPFWNRDVYTSYVDWARWFWRGAVHIDDVVSAVLLSLDLLSQRPPDRHLVLPLDSAYEYTEDDLAHWDADGAGSTFRRHYAEYHEVALAHGLDPAAKPTRLDIPDTIKWLAYRPTYSLKHLLAELAAYGDAGPPPPFTACAPAATAPTPETPSAGTAART